MPNVLTQTLEKLFKMLAKNNMLPGREIKEEEQEQIIAMVAEAITKSHPGGTEAILTDKTLQKTAMLQMVNLACTYKTDRDELLLFAQKDSSADLDRFQNALEHVLRETLLQLNKKAPPEQQLEEDEIRQQAADLAEQFVAQIRNKPMDTNTQATVLINLLAQLQELTYRALYGGMDPTQSSIPIPQPAETAGNLQAFVNSGCNYAPTSIMSDAHLIDTTKTDSLGLQNELKENLDALGDELLPALVKEGLLSSTQPTQAPRLEI